MTLKEMKNKLGALQTRIDELKLAREEREDKKFTDEEKKEFNSTLDSMESLIEDIKAEERSEKAAEFSGNVSQEEEPPSIQVRNVAAESPYSFGEFLQDVAAEGRTGRFSKRLDAHIKETRATGMSEEIPSEGGFLVGADYSNELVRKAHETGILVNRVRKLSMSSGSNTLKVPFVDESSRANGSRMGGVRAYWKGEAAQFTASNPTYGEMTLELNKLTGLSYVTEELLQDTSALEGFLTQAFAEEFGFKLDDGIVNGDGAGKPVGIYNGPALVSVSKETGQEAATFILDNAIKMYARLWARSRGNAVWLMNQDVIPQLFTMSMEVGTGGAPAFIPAGGISNRPYDSLLGIPILYIEQCQTLGTKGDVYLTDLSQYLFVDKGGIQSASSIHIKFDYAETAFRWIYRADGQPTWQSALTPFKGTSNTVSPYIALNTRS